MASAAYPDRMNAYVGFDTHAFVKKVAAAGMPVEQAEALVEALNEHLLDGVTTKGDLRELELRLSSQLKELELRLTSSLTTRLGAMVAGSMALTVAILGALVSLH